MAEHASLQIPAQSAEMAANWRFCALILAEPDVESLAVLRDVPHPPLWLADAVEELSHIALDAWQGEHTRLFVFPAKCPPFASAYLEEGILNGRRSVEMDIFYRTLGLEATNLPADYVGSLCECAAFLVEQTDPDALPEVLAAYGQRYLDDWFDRFLEDLMRHSELRLYRGLAETLAGLLLAQQESEVGYGNAVIGVT